MNANDNLDGLKQTLQQRLAELRLEVQAAEALRRQPPASATGEVSDRKEAALTRQFGDVEQAQEERDLDEVAQIETALARIAAGTYGRCIDCDRTIPAERLRAQPSAMRCAACQSLAESRAGR